MITVTDIIIPIMRFVKSNLLFFFTKLSNYNIIVSLGDETVKKLIVILSLTVLSLSVLCACSRSGDSQADTTTSRPTTVIGEAVKTTAVASGESENIAYMTDDNVTVKMEYLDKDGALKFTEEYIYNEYGDLIGYTYYDKDGKFAAKYISSGDDEGFYYQDGNAMSEEEFSVRMEAIGAMG